MPKLLPDLYIEGWEHARIEFINTIRLRADSLLKTTATFTGHIRYGVLTVSAISSGSIAIGDLITGTGISRGQRVVSQISGNKGSVGEYYVRIKADECPAQTLVQKQPVGDVHLYNIQIDIMRYLENEFSIAQPSQRERAKYKRMA